MTTRPDASKRINPEHETGTQFKDETVHPQSTRAFIDRLSPEDRHALLSKTRREWHEAGSVICRQGDPGDALYIIASGRVTVLKEVSAGRPTRLGYRGAGELVGEMSLVGRQARSASLIAEEDTELLRVEATDFPALMNQHPGISWAILNVLSERLQVADVERTTVYHEEQTLARRLDRLTGEAARLAELARVRQETIELIAHDLRTPLAVIDGCWQMLETSLSPEALGSTAEIRKLGERATSRLMSLLDELLSAAHREVPDASRLAREPVDMAGILRTAVSNALFTARQADIGISLQIPEKLICPQGDSAQLERVVDNLLENAVAYTPTGGEITVQAQEREGTIEVSVSDTGPGVPPEYRNLVFDRFTRVPGIKGRKKGFGLGLYFCRQVVQAHGGRIWVEPGPGNRGSRFAFTLPVDTETDRD
jgi:signal transduction histidine kinase